MRKLTVFVAALMIAFFASSVKETISEDGYDPQTGTTLKERERVKTTVQELLKDESPEIKPNPQRLYCAKLWNVYYEREGFQMKVLTRGNHDEFVIFRCPECSLEREFVDPFLSAEYQGKTGMDRIKECGFLVAIFKGARGIQEIIRKVP